MFLDVIVASTDEGKTTKGGRGCIVHYAQDCEKSEVMCEFFCGNVPVSEYVSKLTTNVRLAAHAELRVKRSECSRVNGALREL